MSAEPTMDFDEIADELYGLPPGDFTARRNAVARTARREGDRELAQRISTLRRPTQSAWILNQWIRRHPDGADDITELGAALREAQRRAAADRLRELSRQRQRVIADAAGQIGRLAAHLDVTLSDATERDIVSTLRAAAADDETADTLRRGRMVTAAEYTGFGPAGMFAVPEPVAATDTGDADAEATDHEARRERAEQELRRAEQHEADARRAADDARTRAADAARAVDTLAAQAQRLRDELGRVEHELGFARRRATAADSESATTATSLESSSAAVEKLRAEKLRAGHAQPRDQR
ncbi:hypothetical protein ACPXB3_20875 [Gordonia sp. DT219]|uniref:hypothetical protein n=1 Tax=Gordonia sp. DT219 TaxID=3416658 RepID=UPI003CF56F85